MRLLVGNVKGPPGPEGPPGEEDGVAWDEILDKPEEFEPSGHASTHASAGSDPVTPASIGAETPAGATTKANNARTTAISTAASDASTKASDAQSAAIAAAAIDASAKASTAQSTAITTAASDASTKVANHAAATDPHGDRAYVDTRFATLLGTAPANLDTLQEIGTQLAADESAVAGLITTVSGKSSKAANLGDLPDPTAARNNIGAEAAGAAATAQTAAITAAALDATSKANDAQATAISSAASDATTKSANAQSAAITAAATDASAKVLAHKNAADPHGDRSYTDTAVGTRLSATDPSVTNARPGIIGPWAATTIYAAGQVVSYLGVLWQAKIAFTSGVSFDASNWTPIGGDWTQEYFRNSGMFSTTRREASASQSGFGSGSSAAGLAICRVAATYTKARIYLTAVGSAITGLKLGVWSSDGSTVVSDSPNISGSLVIGWNTVTLDTPQILVVGDQRFLGFSETHTTTSVTIRGIVGPAVGFWPQTIAEGVISYRGKGAGSWAGGSNVLPGSLIPSLGPAMIPLIELIP